MIVTALVVSRAFMAWWPARAFAWRAHPSHRERRRCPAPCSRARAFDLLGRRQHGGRDLLRLRTCSGPKARCVGRAGKSTAFAALRCSDRTTAGPRAGACGPHRPVAPSGTRSCSDVLRRDQEYVPMLLTAGAALSTLRCSYLDRPAAGPRAGSCGTHRPVAPSGTLRCSDVLRRDQEYVPVLLAAGAAPSTLQCSVLPASCPIKSRDLRSSLTRGNRHATMP